MIQQLRIDSVDTLSVSQAAKIAGVSGTAVRAWIRGGKLPATATPLGSLIDAYDLDLMLISREARRRSKRHAA